MRRSLGYFQLIHFLQSFGENIPSLPVVTYIVWPTHSTVFSLQGRAELYSPCLSRCIKLTSVPTAQDTVPVS